MFKTIFISFLALSFLGTSCNPQIKQTIAKEENAVLGISPAKTEIVEGGWNNRVINREGNKTAREFHGKWINYLDGDNWRKINTSFVDAGTYFTMINAPFEVKVPKFSSGAAEFISNNQWDVFLKEKIADPPFSQTIKALGVNNVTGTIENGDLGWGQANYVIYPNAYPTIGADLIYYVHFGRAPSLKKLIRFNANPNLSQDLRLEFELAYSSDPDIDFKEKSKNKWNKTTKIITNRGISHKPFGASGSRGIGLKDFTIWDSGKKIKWQNIDIEYKKIGNVYKLTKIIPATFFADIVYPVFTDITNTFYPDPDVENTSVDGDIEYFTGGLGSGVAWATIHDAADGTTANPSAASANIIEFTSDNVSPNWRRIRRVWLLFDTSTIAAGSTIDAATLSLYSAGIKADGLAITPDIDIYTTTPASNTNLVVGDYDQIGATSQTGSPISFASWNGTDTAVNQFTLNATGRGNIIKAGITKFGARNANYDAINSAPVWSSNAISTINIYLAETAGTATDPKLVVTSTPAAVDALQNAAGALLIID